MNPIYIVPIVAVGLTCLGLLGGVLVKAFHVGRDVGDIKRMMAQTAHLASYVPAIWRDVEYVKRHLSISTPQMPSFIIDHDAEE